MLGAVGMDLGSLGGMGGGGDIWSTNGFSFESPLKDVLDRPHYTVEDLLQEDELLQELRGCHDVLITYLSTEAAVMKLVQYVIQPPVSSSTVSSSDAAAVEVETTGTSNTDVERPMNGSRAPDNTTTTTTTTNNDRNSDTKPGKWLLRYLQEMQQSIPSMMTDNDEVPSSSSSVPSQQPHSSTLTMSSPLVLRQIRFPYMACEIICCEIPSILQTLVDGKCRTAPPPTANDTHHNNDDDHTNPVLDSDIVPPTTTTEEESNVVVPSDTNTMMDVTHIITSHDSQGEDMVEVMTQTNTTAMTAAEVVEDKEEEEEPPTPQPLSLLDLLFSLLYQTPTGALDDYRAGYFDKILSVLFRKRPEELTIYINSGGIYGRRTLMECMFRHLYSHSIMQIAQRLLLPQRPMGQPQPQLTESSQTQNYDDDDDDDDKDANILILSEQDTIPEEYQAQQQHNNNNNNNNTENGAEIVAGDDGDDDPEALGVRCDWSNSPEVLDMLLGTLIGPEPRSSLSSSDIDGSQVLDLSLNASEVLITIIQNSMLSSPTMLRLTSNDVIARIVDAATTLPDPEYFSPHESVLTSAMNVLESLVLQLGGYGAVGTMTLLPEDEMNPPAQNEIGNDGDAMFDEDPPSPIHKMTDQIQEVNADDDDALNTGQEVGLVVDKNLISDLSAMLDHLPRLLERLSMLLRHPSTTSWTSPTQFSKNEPVQLLGNSRLRIVRVLESLVLLGDPDVDSILVQSNCLEICLDFFWEFQWCSMLHQSVANLLVHVFEGQNTRFEMQKYFLVKCNLLGRLIDSFTDDKGCHEIGNAINTNSQTLSVGDNNMDSNAMTADTLEAQMDDAAELSAMQESKNVGQIDGKKEELAPSETHLTPPAQALRCGYMGHVIIICQALVHAYTSNPHEHIMNEDADGLDNDQMRNMNEISYEEAEHEASEVSLNKMKVEVEALESPPGVNSQDIEEEDPTGPKDIYGDPLLLFEIVHTHHLAEKWHDFVDTTLAAETAIQSTPLGGSSMQPTGSDMLLSHRPGLADEGYMMGDDGEGPPVPPRGMLGGGDMIHMDENDLDIAASLMAGLSYGRPNAPDIDEDHSNNSADSEKSYNSGETAREKVGYAFDDPLGKAGGLGIELDKLTKYSTGGTAAGTSYNGDDDDGSHSSDEDDIDSKRSGSGDVPVMDLFAGNFNYEQTSDREYSVTPAEEFANFAAFDSTGTDDVGVFVGIVDEALPVPTTNTASTDLDNLFGKGDHAELLEMDDLPTEEALSPIKPTTPFEEQHYVSVAIADNARHVGSSDNTSATNNNDDDDVKVDLFDAQDGIVEEKTMTFDVDIETAPSDELMADQIEPVSLDTVVKEDIGQL